MAGCPAKAGQAMRLAGAFKESNLDPTGNKQLKKYKQMKIIPMKTRKTVSFVLTMMVTLLLTNTFISCNNKTKKATSVEAEAVAADEIRKDIEAYVYPISSTFDVTKMLNEIEATYIFDIAHDAENAGKYFTDKNKALNLGIYLADLAYAATYNQKAEVQSYFEAIEQLVGELDLTAAFKRDVASKIRENLDKQEELTNLIINYTEDAYEFLHKQGRDELSYLIVSGTAVEGLYLTTHISENTFNNPEIIKVILYQKDYLKKLETQMAQYRESEMSAESFEYIRSINEVYAMEEGSSSMTEEQIVKLTDMLETIREKNLR